MTVGTFANFKEWTRGKGISWGPTGPYLSGELQELSAELPDTYSRSIVFFDAILQPFISAQLADAALYVVNSALWTETATPLLFDRFRASAAMRRLSSVDDEGFTSFEGAAFDDLYGLSLLAALGRWDGWVVLGQPSYLVELSHDGFISIATALGTLLDAVAERFAEAQFPFQRQTIRQ